MVYEWITRCIKMPYLSPVGTWTLHSSEGHSNILKGQMLMVAGIERKSSKTCANQPSVSPLILSSVIFINKILIL